jgi:hypothetical protein
LIAKTKLAKNCPKNSFSIPSIINKKMEDEKIVDSFKKRPFSNENSTFTKLKKNREENMDIEMKIENKKLNEPLKDSLNDEQMDIINEEEFKKKAVTNDSLDNFSTANSIIENDISQKKQNLSKKKIEFKVNGKADNTLEVSKEMESNINANLQNVNEYIDEIFQNLINEEDIINLEIDANYLEYQPEINEKMRAILIDWLIDVNNRFHYKEETLYTTIYIMDRYLSKKVIKRKRFQLLGITSLFIASKLNEIYFRRISDYVFISDNTYTQDEIKIMEEDISKALNFDFLFPSPLSFFEILSKKLGLYEDLNSYYYGQCLMQTFLMDIRSLNYSYSTIACTCCYIVMKFYKNENYKICYNSKFYTVKKINIYTDINSYIIKECAKNICSIISEYFNSNIQATFNKFKDYQFYKDIKAILYISKN